MTSSHFPNIEPETVDSALKALADALHGEGPAVELSADADGHVVVSTVDTPGFEDAAVVVRTSGSTGTPKATVLTVEALAASSVATAFALKGEGQWLLALPLQYVAGVQVLVRSLFAGTRPWAMDLSEGFTPEAFTAAAQELTDKIRFTSLVPTQLQRLLEAPSPETLAVLRRFNGILLGGGPARSGTAGRGPRGRRPGGHHLRFRGNLRRLRVRRLPARGRRGPGRGGRPDPAGRRHHGRRIPRRSRATADDFFEEDGVRWYRTSDLGTLDADGRLTVLGRADDVIITGGVKVSAAHVQEELEKSDGVTAAFVAGVPSAKWGQAVAAYVAVAGRTEPRPQVGAASDGVGLGRTEWHQTLGLLAPKTVLAGRSC